MVMQDYSDLLRYAICVENIAYSQHSDYDKCEKMAEKPLDDAAFYSEKFPLFFKNLK